MIHLLCAVCIKRTLQAVLRSQSLALPKKVASNSMAAPSPAPVSVASPVVDVTVKVTLANGVVLQLIVPVDTKIQALEKLVIRDSGLSVNGSKVYFSIISQKNHLNI